MNSSKFLTRRRLDHLRSGMHASALILSLHMSTTGDMLTRTAMNSCRSQQMVRGGQAVASEKATNSQHVADLDHDTILHIFRCIAGDADELIGVDDLMKQVRK